MTAFGFSGAVCVSLATRCFGLRILLGDKSIPCNQIAYDTCTHENPRIIAVKEKNYLILQVSVSVELTASVNAFSYHCFFFPKGIWGQRGANGF